MSELLDLARRVELLRRSEEWADMEIKEAIPRTRYNPKPKYTASLDAALTLLPQGWLAWEMRTRDGLTRYYVSLCRPVGDALFDWDDEEEVVLALDCTSAALAMCAAALRARAINAGATLGEANAFRFHQRLVNS